MIFRKKYNRNKWGIDNQLEKKILIPILGEFFSIDNFGIDRIKKIKSTKEAIELLGDGNLLY